MLEAIVGNLIASVASYLLFILPLYFILKRFQKNDEQKIIASVYFKTGTIALVLHCFSLPLYDTILIHITADTVFISVFYWLHIAYMFMSFNALISNKKDETEKEDDQ